MGGFGCVEAIRRALHETLRARNLDPWQYDPWFFPSVEEYSSLLQAQGFTIASILLFPRPTPLPGDIGGWLETFAQPFLHAFSPSERATYLDEVRARVQPTLYREDSGWTADYTRLRFRALRPAA